MPESNSQIEYYVLNCNPVDLKVDPDKLDLHEDSANTLSDISTYASDSSDKLSLTKSDSSKSSASDERIPLPHLIEENDLDSDSVDEKTSKTVRIREMTDSMLKDRIVEVGVQPWQSKSIKQFKNSSEPRLLEEKIKKRVIFSPNSTFDNQHVYENIDDCREQGFEHPNKVLPIPGKRLPFRQPPRVPVLSIHQRQDVQQPKYVDEDQIDPEISYVSYRFYDKEMREQKTLSQRTSAKLLQKTAMRLSICSRSKPNGVSSIRLLIFSVFFFQFFCF